VGNRRTSTPIGTLDAHPNVDEIRAVISRLPCISDTDLHRLARAWHNTTLLAEARRRALEPDSPLVVEALSWFDTLQSLYADEIRGEADYVNVDVEVTSTALKAVRDAIAASYARPMLTTNEHSGLMNAWREVYPSNEIVEPDLGTRAADVTRLLVSFPRLATRCHDARAAAECAAILFTAETLDEDIRVAARDEAWHAAVLTSRRQLWHLVRRRGLADLGYCATCQTRCHDESTVRVLALCVDAACGLLVAGSLEEDIVDVLLEPVHCLIPESRPSTAPE
jgi:hypothetical protein